jgi:hypothetical protein
VVGLAGLSFSVALNRISSRVHALQSQFRRDHRPDRIIGARLKRRNICLNGIMPSRQFLRNKAIGPSGGDFHMNNFADLIIVVVDDHREEPR